MEKLASGQRIITHLVVNGEDPLAFAWLVKNASTDPNMQAFADDVAYALVYAQHEDAAVCEKIAGFVSRAHDLATGPLDSVASGYFSGRLASRGGHGFFSKLLDTVDLLKDYYKEDPLLTLVKTPGYMAGLVAGHNPVLATGAGALGLAALPAAGAVAQRRRDDAHPFRATMRNFGF